MNDDLNPTGLNPGRREAQGVTATNADLQQAIAEATTVIDQIADVMPDTHPVEASVLAALMTKALCHKAFFQAVLTTRSKP
jgi:hypothetical protein